MDSHLLDVCPFNDHYVFPADAMSRVTIGYQPKQAGAAAAHAPGEPMEDESKGDQPRLPRYINISRQHARTCTLVERLTHCPLCKRERTSDRQLLVCGVRKLIGALYGTAHTAQVRHTQPNLSLSLCLSVLRLFHCHTGLALPFDSG